MKTDKLNYGLHFRLTKKNQTMKNIFTTLLIIFLFSRPALAQLDSIYDQNVWRTFIVHLPTGYSSSNQYPIILNLHGLNSDAAQQQSYTQFDNIADNEGFIVVYPNGISKAWAINGNTDVDFLSHLVDTIRANYSCNTCLFVTGMSYGGFMTYKFACATTQAVKAIAIGSGNMAKALQNSSAAAPKIPVMHFHGTADQLVAYGGVPPLIPPVDTTIKWWVNHNNCNPTPIFTAIPNINTTDNCTVEKYYYGGGTNGSEITFYKVINGGHTWSGAVPAPPLGFTNQDINQSAIIGSFFAGFCSATTGFSSVTIDNSISLYPNPFTDQVTFASSTNEKVTVILYDYLSRQILLQTFTNTTTISTNQLLEGLYIYELRNDKGTIKKGKVIKQ
jgi:polyhydroxybutyrate depolymerase